MTEDQFKPHIRRWFTDNGFVVTDIPCSREHGKLTPDFHLAKGAEEYLLELKIKGDDEEELTRDTAILASGQILERSVPLSPRTRLNRIIKDGHKQMLEFDPQLRCLHVLWIHCEGRDAHLLKERFRLTLFGQQKLLCMDRQGFVEALYFHNSSFWRFRHALDGMLLTSFNGAALSSQLCVNTVSNRVNTFRASSLFDLHRNGLFDPKAFTDDTEAFIVDSDVERTDEAAVLAFLRAKYGVEHLQTFGMGAYSVATPMNLPDR